MFTPSILKMKTVYNLITSFCLLAFQLGFAQQKSYITEKDVWFDLEVRVVDKTSQKSIKRFLCSFFNFSKFSSVDLIVGIKFR